MKSFREYILESTETDIVFDILSEQQYEIDDDMMNYAIEKIRQDDDMRKNTYTPVEFKHEIEKSVKFNDIRPEDDRRIVFKSSSGDKFYVKDTYFDKVKFCSVIVLDKSVTNNSRLAVIKKSEIFSGQSHRNQCFIKIGLSYIPFYKNLNKSKYNYYIGKLGDEIANRKQDLLEKKHLDFLVSDHTADYILAKMRGVENLNGYYEGIAKDYGKNWNYTNDEYSKLVDKFIKRVYDKAGTKKGEFNYNIENKSHLNYCVNDIDNKKLSRCVIISYYY